MEGRKNQGNAGVTTEGGKNMWPDEATHILMKVEVSKKKTIRTYSTDQTPCRNLGNQCVLLPSKVREPAACRGGKRKVIEWTNHIKQWDTKATLG